MNDGPWLWPGLADPVPDEPPAAVAERFGTDAAAVRSWLADGCPQTPCGLVDPFVCCNWLSWGRLERAPVLARRWRTYLATFRPFVSGRERPWRCRWQRCQRLYLPAGIARVRCWWPRPPTGPGQRVEYEADPGGRREAGWDVVGYRPAIGDDRPATIEHRAEVGLTLTPRQDRLQGGDRAWLEAQVQAFVEGFVYGYKRHRPGNTDRIPGTGSCLDCAQELQERFHAVGRPAVLVGGIIARDAVVNPHFWLEVAVAGGSVAVDPSLPAIARMLGQDWPAWVRAYVGGHDARRITLARGPSPIASLPGGPAFSLAIGEALAWPAAGGRPRNAWPCLDQVCGETSGLFTVDQS